MVFQSTPFSWPKLDNIGFKLCIPKGKRKQTPSPPLLVLNARNYPRLGGTDACPPGTMFHAPSNAAPSMHVADTQIHPMNKTMIVSEPQVFANVFEPKTQMIRSKQQPILPTTQYMEDVEMSNDGIRVETTETKSSDTQVVPPTKSIILCIREDKKTKRVTRSYSRRTARKLGKEGGPTICRKKDECFNVFDDEDDEDEDEDDAVEFC